LVVEVAGDSLAIFQHGELLDALHETRVVDLDARRGRQCYRQVLVVLAEFFRALLLAEIQIPEHRVSNPNRDAEERTHRRMVRRSTIGRLKSEPTLMIASRRRCRRGSRSGDGKAAFSSGSQEWAMQCGCSCWTTMRSFAVAWRGSSNAKATSRSSARPGLLP